MKRVFVIAVAMIVGIAGYSVFPLAVPTEEKSGVETPPETFVFTYGIKGGDSMSLIAHRFGLSLKTLASANIVKNGTIYEGDILGIPLKRSSIAEFHKVSEGETLWSIAQRYGTSVENIMKLNRMKNDMLFVSEKIVVRRNRESGSRFVVFKVGPDDTPSEISESFGVNLADIERLNAYNPGWREPGSHIVVDTFQYRYSERIRESIIETARAYLGSPYKYGGNSTETGIDCSAYVKKVFSRFGVNLPRTVRTMHKHAKGLWINKDYLEKGDLVFFETDRPFPSHIGIYIDKGDFIHASSAQGKVVVSNLGEPYYVKTYIGAKRIYIRNRAAAASGNLLTSQ